MMKKRRRDYQIPPFNGEKLHIRQSKTCTQILRFVGPWNGVPIERSGYAKVDNLLEVKEVIALGITRSILVEIVRNNNKGRFEMMTDSSGVDWIRATQGHSKEIDIDMEQLCGPILRSEDIGDDYVCYHGTYQSYYDNILAVGLLPGGKKGAEHRSHIHMAEGLPSEKEHEKSTIFILLLLSFVAIRSCSILSISI